MKYNMILVVVLALLINSCFNPEQGCKKFVDEFFPIAEGNRWEYNTDNFNDGILDTTRQYSHTRGFEEVYREKINNNNEDIGIEYLISDEPDEIGWIAYQNSSGIFELGFYFNDSLVYHEPVLIYKYPVNVNDSWLVRRYTPKLIEPWLTDRGNIKFSCVATDEPFITPADTFFTTVYHYLTLYGLDGYHQHTYEYFSYGIGKVGMEIYLSTDTTYNYSQKNHLDLHRRITLVDYCLY